MYQECLTMDDADHLVNKFTRKSIYLIEKVFPEEPIRKKKKIM